MFIVCGMLSGLARSASLLSDASHLPHQRSNSYGLEVHLKRKRYTGRYLSIRLRCLLGRTAHNRDVTVYTRNWSISCIVYRVSCIHVHTRNFINTRKYIHEIFRVYKFLKNAFIFVLSNIIKRIYFMH